jgi:alpha-beta hydrolase superfamily lysophospholipase
MLRALALLPALLATLPIEGSAQERRAIPVSFMSEGGIRIAADYLRPRGSKPVLVMLHGVGAGRREWDPLVAEAAKLGFGTLQFDARGHGGSGGPSYTTFQTQESWEAVGKDFSGALAFLESRGFPPERTALVGASIGANLALREALREPRIPFVVLLSPGMDYQGVRLKPDFLRYGRPVLAAAAPGDAYSMRTCQELAPALKRQDSRFLQAASGHGAQMLAGEVNRPFLRELLRWLSDRAASSQAETPASPKAQPARRPAANPPSP